jgi:GDPmannose 4,6-dehydratase
MIKKTALITGITGQDGSYLADLLMQKGYEVHGVIRRTSAMHRERIEQLTADPHSPKAKIHLHYGDLSDSSSMNQIMKTIKPQEVYHLGAQSHVKISFEIPEYTGDVTGLGTLRILEAIRESGVPTKFYQASSSEMFGQAPEAPQDEKTAFHPRSPYGCAKVYAYWTAVNYREAYGIFACNGILFNHESPRRGENFVSRKITRGVARIVAGLDQKLFLGNLQAKRDWGYAPEYVEAMWRMLQQEKADDYVIATGETHSVEEFAREAFDYAGLDWKKYVEIDPRYFRAAEVDLLLGDNSKAKRLLGWEPKVKFRDLVRIMLDADLALLGRPSPKRSRIATS